MDFTPTLTDDCLLAIFGKVPLQQRLTTVPLVCRRWAQLQPLVRRDVTSLTLLSGDLTGFNPNQLRSPFHLVNDQATVIDTLDLLQPTSKTSSDAEVLFAVERLCVELPNIHRLTIVQLNQVPSDLQPELLSVVEHYLGQLTSFAYHCLFQSNNTQNNYSIELNETAAQSCSLYRLLSLINYGAAPQLRHLLLNSDQSFFVGASFSSSSTIRHYPRSPAVKPRGSLYLPVLRRLESFSFRSADHLDTLLASLVKFGGSGNGGRLKIVRLEPFSPTGKHLWREGVLRDKLDYLAVKDSELLAAPYLNASFANIRYLHTSCYQGADLKPLFTVLSNSFPRLSTFSLDLSLRGVDIPEGPLPPLPSVTRLALSVSLNFPGCYGYILEPHRVFPALRELTIGRFTCSYENVSLHRSFNRGFSRQHIDSLLKCYPPSALRQISLKKDNGMKYKRVYYE